MLKILILVLVVMLVFKVAQIAMRTMGSPKSTPQSRSPRPVNDDFDPAEPEVLLPEQEATSTQSYWQKKLKDAYRQGYKDGLDDGKGQSDGKL
ncbi:MAG: hypothetical protein KBC57_00625 [Neisseriaceae bacterium]|nr:hypothetical protein [Neisseriaceae bacterium]MBP6860844.1 hypothetical protein [Neisseriaceae bacterium]